jgi:DNA repair exonuclease SbcCD nuclease subunit
MSYERFELPGLVVHAVPQMLTVEATLEALEQADRSRSLDCTNLLLTHPRVPQVEPRYADINEIEVDAGLLRSDLVLLGHYHVHTPVNRGIWYAGSTDTFSFADDPDRPKGIVVLDTDTGECRHVPLPGRRPLVTLETVYALGLSPAEVEAQVVERAAGAPDGAVARLYLEGIAPEAYRLLDMDAVREAAAAALVFKLEPTFADTVGMVELPELDAMPARWHRYVDDQDLAGFDRERIRSKGNDYIVRAIESAVD